MKSGGKILAITYAEGSRTGGLQPWVGMGSAKAALESLVRYFGVALAKKGITVNAISPGWTEDSVLNSLPKQVQELITNWHVRGWTPMGRLGTPADVAGVVGLFCQKDADWITGQVIYADGGASLMNPEVPTEIQIGCLLSISATARLCWSRGAPVRYRSRRLESAIRRRERFIGRRPRRIPAGANPPQ